MESTETMDDNETAQFVNSNDRLKVVVRIRPFLREEMKNRK